MDIAEDTMGRWWVVEVNDGHRSGVPCDDEPKDYDRFYSGLKEAVEAWCAEGPGRAHFCQ